MKRHVLERLERSPGTLLGLTPQGRFTDPREPIRLRPGAAAIAASCERSPRVVVVSIEYVFWQDARPETSGGDPTLRLVGIGFDDRLVPCDGGWNETVHGRSRRGEHRP